METEKNQSIDGIKIHDVVTISKHQKTGADGEKRGYLYGRSDKVALVVGINKEQQSLVLTLPDGSEDTYDTEEDESHDYYYSVSIGSEVLYLRDIESEIKDEEEKMIKAQRKVIELEEWRDTFKNSISFMGQLIRFVKGAQK